MTHRCSTAELNRRPRPHVCPAAKRPGMQQIGLDSLTAAEADRALNMSKCFAFQPAGPGFRSVPSNVLAGTLGADAVSAVINGGAEPGVSRSPGLHTKRITIRRRTTASGPAPSNSVRLLRSPLATAIGCISRSSSTIPAYRRRSTPHWSRSGGDDGFTLIWSHVSGD